MVEKKNDICFFLYQIDWWFQKVTGLGWCTTFCVHCCPPQCHFNTYNTTDDAPHVTPFFSMPKDLKYADSHEWVKVEGDSATVGITDYAQVSTFIFLLL